MDNESANYYTREVMVILIREFQSPDEEMKKIVLKVCHLHGHFLSSTLATTCVMPYSQLELTILLVS